MSPRMQERPSTASTVSACRGSHPEDRSEDRPCARHDPGARRRRRLGARVGRRDALGGAVSGPEDPSSGSPNRGDSSHYRVQPLVTGVTWIEGELWHGTHEGDESDLRRVDPRTGEVLESLEMPPGVELSGLESDGRDQFFCGGGRSGKVRTVRRPKRGSATGRGSEIGTRGARDGLYPGGRT